MKVLIAGGSGFIGSHIVERFLKNPDTRVWILTRDPKRAAVVLPDERVSFVDLSEGWKVVEGILHEVLPDVVVNSVGILYGKREDFRKVHVEFLKNLLNSLEGIPIRRFVHISACGVGRHFVSEYLRTKYEAEKLVQNSVFKYTIFRPSIVMGRRQLLLRQMERVAKIFPLVIVPRFKVQPINVYDLAEAVYKSVFSKEFENRVCELGGPEVIPFKELVKRVLKYLRMERPVIDLPWWFLLPSVPVLKLFGMGNFDTLKMASVDNVCPENCLYKLVSEPRELFDF